MDLNILKYSVLQLLDFFKLNSQSLNDETLDNAYNLIIDKIKSSSFTQKEKDKTLKFYTDAKEILKNNIIKRTREIRRQYINIDTKFRQDYYTTTSSSFLINLPTLLKNVIEIGIESFEQPIEISYYIISSSLGNNCFSIQSFDTDLAGLTIVIPNGNYSTTTLIAFINNILSLQTTSLNKIVVSTAGSFLNGTDQILFAIKDPNNLFNFLLDFQVNSLGESDNVALQLKLGWIMGFRNAAYTGNSAYCSEAVCDLSPPKYIFLSVDDFNVGGFNSTQVIYNQSISTQNIIGRISNTNSSIYNAKTISLPRTYINDGATIQKLQITLLDPYGRTLTTNNMDYSFVLSLKLFI